MAGCRREGGGRAPSGRRKPPAGRPAGGSLLAPVARLARRYWHFGSPSFWPAMTAVP